MPVIRRAPMTLLALAVLATTGADAEQLYSIDVANDRLMRLDAVSGAVTDVGPLGDDALDIDLAFTAAGRLWGLNSGSGTSVDLSQIDTFADQRHRLDTVTGAPIGTPETLVENRAYNGLARDLGAASLVLSPDVTTDLAGTQVEDQDVASDDGAGSVATLAIGTLPIASDLTAYTRAANGDHLFSLDTTVDLGGVVARPGDVVRYDGLSYSIEFDAEAAGVPLNANTDAVSVAAGGILLSFDTTVDLGEGIAAADEDLVVWDGAFFNWVFIGSAQGLDARLDIDAVRDLGGGSYLMSFDTAGEIAGIAFDDEDVLAFDPSGPVWSVYYDGSSVHAALATADVVALPEPAGPFQLAAGVGMLAWLWRRRRPCAGPAAAVHGVLEVDRTCAVQTGCS